MIHSHVVMQSCFPRKTTSRPVRSPTGSSMAWVSPVSIALVYPSTMVAATSGEWNRPTASHNVSPDRSPNSRRLAAVCLRYRKPAPDWSPARIDIPSVVTSPDVVRPGASIPTVPTARHMPRDGGRKRPVMQGHSRAGNVSTFGCPLRSSTHASGDTP